MPKFNLQRQRSNWIDNLKRRNIWWKHCAWIQILFAGLHINANQPEATAIYYFRGSGHWPFILYLETADVPSVYSWMSLNCTWRDGWGSGVGKEERWRKVDDEEWRAADSGAEKSKIKREKEKKLRRCRHKQDRVIDFSKQKELRPDWRTLVRSIQCLIHRLNKATPQGP